MANSPILGIAQVAPNQNNKETTINDGFAAIERSLNDILVLNMSGGHANLAPLDFQRYAIFQCQGHNAPRNLIVVKQKRLFIVRNGGSGVVTVRMDGQTNNNVVEVPPGSMVLMYADGNLSITKISDSAASALAPSLIGLTDTPDAYTALAGRLLRVKASMDGIEFGEITLADLKNVATIVGQAGRYPRVNAAGDGIEFVAANPGGETEFLLLNDTPNTYAGKTLGFVRVNAAGTALEFVDRDAALSIRNLTDVPDSFAGAPAKLLAVNANGDGIEFVDAPDFDAKRVTALDISDPSLEQLIGENGWSVAIGSPVFHKTLPSIGSIDAASDGALFYAFEGAQGSSAGRIETIVSLGNAAGEAQLDASAKVDVSVKYRTVGAAARGRLEITALTETNAVLISASAKDLSSEAKWAVAAVSMRLPVGTRFLKIGLEAADAFTTGAAEDRVYGAVAFDAVSGSIEVVEGLSFLALGDAPDTFEDAAGKLVRVSADGTRLEFFTLALALRDLLGFPSSYTGEAGKFVVVAENESGVAFVDPAPLPRPIRTLTTSRPLALEDAGAYLRATGGVPLSLTIPLHANTALPIGTEIAVNHRGEAGLSLTLEPVAGVTLSAAQRTLFNPFERGSLVKVAEDAWDFTLGA